MSNCYTVLLLSKRATGIILPTFIALSLFVYFPSLAQIPGADSAPKTGQGTASMADAGPEDGIWDEAAVSAFEKAFFDHFTDFK